MTNYMNIYTGDVDTLAALKTEFNTDELTFMLMNHTLVEVEETATNTWEAVDPEEQHFIDAYN